MAKETSDLENWPQTETNTHPLPELVKKKKKEGAIRVKIIIEIFGSMVSVLDRT
jgi:hypothetical protein